MKRLLMIGIGGFLLVGCGSGGTKSQSIIDQLKNIDKIIVYYNYPPNVCVEKKQKKIVEDKGAKDVITSVQNSDVSCATTFGITNDTSRCQEVYVNKDFSESCVVGYNR